MKRVSYQSGSIVRKKRSRGPDVWALRYKDGDIQRSEILGAVDQLKTKAAARREGDAYLLKINERKSGTRVSGLCDRYDREGMEVRAQSAATYRTFLKRVRGHWGDWYVADMAKDVMAVEEWVNGFTTLGSPNHPPRPASKKTKLHVKAFVHRLFQCAMKWGILEMQINPMTLINVKGKRMRTRALTLLSGDQYRALIADPLLSEHVRVMIQVAMLLGLRASEILGLRWEDVDFAAAIVSVRRSVVEKEVGETKTPESEAELPLHDELAAVLIGWREAAEPVNGWLFGNVITGRPFWRGTLQQDHLGPAGKRIGIAGLGWHAFRHTYRAMMGQLNVPLDMQQSLMRHADISTTLSYGGKTPASKSRPFNAQVVEIMKKRA